MPADPEWVIGPGGASALAAAVPASLARLRATLPPLFGETGWMATLLASLAAQFDDLSDAQQSLLAQARLATVSWGLVSWERDLGLAADDTLSFDARLERVVTSYQALFGTPPSLEAFVQHQLLQSAPPTVLVARDQWLVYILADEGWPGDEAYATAKELLDQRLPAHINGGIAPHDIHAGLTVAQLDQMTVIELDALTVQQIDGGA